ncbi:putative PurR-regulated permease PerM [Nitrosospira sp. Nsp2]|uniref:AI-2E family transporter n=1 Tax=Nitrosospira sp. Nsp2 TaxID=136548 RepID=UPI000D2F92D1|nr:AI-2E family transporter [Nitrosospira sp. Nsp2]PTR17599.1 putative PurR-regulated permease PerM [Nitrosospira sp. Nsp2]
MNSTELQHKAFLLLLVAVSVAFGTILLPFYGAVFWACVLAIMFTPFYRRLLVLIPKRENLAAFATLLLCLVIVILPATFITTSLLHEGHAFYQKISSGELKFGTYFHQAISMLPPWIVNLLDGAGLAKFSEAKDTLSNGAAQETQLIAVEGLKIGQNTFEFIVSFGVMLYLLFFLLRDGNIVFEKIRLAIPLHPEHKRHLFSKFTTVVRATVKGNIAVAALQGALGGVIFAFLGIPGAVLWGTVMAFLSLLPAIGAGLVWGPVAIYFLLTGAIFEGTVLIVFGIFVIGLVDNILRPILVGADTQIPDYMVLISTLGGMVLFGLTGFVIGPVIAALFMAAWDLFSSSRQAQ